MRCSKCGLVLPDDSEFCQYCGAKLEPLPLDGEMPKEISAISVQQEQASTHSEKNTEIEQLPCNSDPQEEKICQPSASAPVIENTAIPSPTLYQTGEQEGIKKSKRAKKKSKTQKVKRRYCKFCGQEIDCKTKKCTGCGKQYLRWKRLCSVVVFAIALIVAITVSVCQYLYTLELKKEITFLTEIKNAVLDLRSSDVGAASDNFRIENGVVVLKRTGGKKELLLTAKGGRNSRLAQAISDKSVATVTVEKEDYRTSKITITPKKKGATILTISNSYDYETFKVLIVVTD